MVEAECPFLTWGEGTVLIPAKDGEMYSKEHGYSPSDKKLFLSDMPNYPKIFRPMHWSEGRSLGEMPEYVKGVDSEGNYCVAWVAWVKRRDRVMMTNKILDNGFFDPRDRTYDTTPATEAEYLEYLKSKEK